MTTQTSGHCPKCNGQELEYAGSRLLDESMAYEIKCLDCGFKGWEVHDVTFSCFENEDKTPVESSGECDHLVAIFHQPTYKKVLLSEYKEGMVNHTFQDELLSYCPKCGKLIDWHQIHTEMNI